MRERDYTHENNNQVMAKLVKYFRKGGLCCWYCPPHRGENSHSTSKHGARMPRYKNMRRA